MIASADFPSSSAIASFPPASDPEVDELLTLSADEDALRPAKHWSSISLAANSAKLRKGLVLRKGLKMREIEIGTAMADDRRRETL